MFSEYRRVAGEEIEAAYRVQAGLHRDVHGFLLVLFLKFLKFL